MPLITFVPRKERIQDELKDYDSYTDALKQSPDRPDLAEYDSYVQSIAPKATPAPSATPTPASSVVTPTQVAPTQVTATPAATPRMPSFTVAPAATPGPAPTAAPTVTPTTSPRPDLADFDSYVEQLKGRLGPESATAATLSQPHATPYGDLSVRRAQPPGTTLGSPQGEWGGPLKLANPMESFNAQADKLGRYTSQATRSLAAGTGEAISGAVGQSLQWYSGVGDFIDSKLGKIVTDLGGEWESAQELNRRGAERDRERNRQLAAEGMPQFPVFEEGLLMAAGKAAEAKGKAITEQFPVERPYENMEWNDPGQLGRALIDPSFWATEVARTIPNTLAYIPAGAGAQALAAPRAEAVAAAWAPKLEPLVAKVAPKLAENLGPRLAGLLRNAAAGFGMRTIESSQEAGQRYKEGLDEGLPEEEAVRQGGEVFLKNLPLAALDAVQWVGAFRAMPAATKQAMAKGMVNKLGAAGKAAAVFLFEGLGEGFEEVLQSVAQDQAAGRPTDLLSNEKAQSFVLGSLTGLVLPGVGIASSKAKEAFQARREQGQAPGQAALGTALGAARQLAPAMAIEEVERPPAVEDASEGKQPWQMTRQGFTAQPGIVYHGTRNGDISAFDPLRRGTSTDAGLLGSGFYFSTDPNVVSEGEQSIPAKLAYRNPLTLRIESWGADKTRIINDALGTSGLVGKPLSVKLREQGYDAVVLDYSPIQYQHQEIMVPDANQIATHRGTVEQALAEGQPVPAEVLADYPDLAAKQPSSPAEPAGAVVQPPATAPGAQATAGQAIQAPQPSTDEAKKIAAGRTSNRTGLTPGQEQYLAASLEQIAPKLPAQIEPSTFYETRPEQRAHIKVPGDGEFNIYSQQQAANLHYALTKKGIEGAPQPSKGISTAGIGAPTGPTGGTSFTRQPLPNIPPELRDLQDTAELVQAAKARIGQLDRLATGTFRGEPVWSNGFIFDHGTPPATGKYISANKAPEGAFDKMMSEDATTPLYPVGTTSDEYGSVLLVSPDKRVAFSISADYYAYFLRRYGQPQFLTNGNGKKPIAVVSDGKIVGGVMPQVDVGADTQWRIEHPGQARPGEETDATTFGQRALQRRIEARQEPAATEVQGEGQAASVEESPPPVTEAQPEPPTQQPLASQPATPAEPQAEEAPAEQPAATETVQEGAPPAATEPTGFKKYGRTPRPQSWEVSESDYIEHKIWADGQRVESNLRAWRKELEGPTKRRKNLEFWIRLDEQLLEERKAGPKPGDIQRAREEYIEIVKKAISKGEAVPQAVIDQRPEFKLAKTARERYEKGVHTSFANRSAAINDTMQEGRGYKVKRQDGKPITQEQIDEIGRGMDELERVFGPLANIMRVTDLTIAHTSGKHPFLTGFGGVYSVKDRTISTGVAGWTGRRIASLAHEWAHWLDYEAGAVLGKEIRIKRGEKYVPISALSQAEAGNSGYGNDMIRRARRLINNEWTVKSILKKEKAELTEAEIPQAEVIKIVLGSYWKEPREIWARLVEQYMSNKLGNDANAVSVDKDYTKMPGWWKAEDFAELEPAVEAEIKRRLDLMHSRVPTEESKPEPAPGQEVNVPPQRLEEEAPIEQAQPAAAAEAKELEAQPATRAPREAWEVPLNDYLASSITERRRERALWEVENAVGRIGREKLEEIRFIRPGESMQEWLIRENQGTAEWVAQRPGGPKSTRKGLTAIEKWSQKPGIFKDVEAERQLRKAVLTYIRGYRDTWLEKGEYFDGDQDYIHTPTKHRKIVEQALAAGKPVPANVLADYPDLANRQPAAAPQPEVPASEDLQRTIRDYLGGQEESPREAEPLPDVMVMPTIRDAEGPDVAPESWLPVRAAQDATEKQQGVIGRWADGFEAQGQSYKIRIDDYGNAQGEYTTGDGKAHYTKAANKAGELFGEMKPIGGIIVKEWTAEARPKKAPKEPKAPNARQPRAKVVAPEKPVSPPVETRSPAETPPVVPPAAPPAMPPAEQPPTPPTGTRGEVPPPEDPGDVFLHLVGTGYWYFPKDMADEAVAAYGAARQGKEAITWERTLTELAPHFGQSPDELVKLWQGAPEGELSTGLAVVKAGLMENERQLRAIDERLRQNGKDSDESEGLFEGELAQLQQERAGLMTERATYWAALNRRGGEVGRALNILKIATQVNDWRLVADQAAYLQQFAKQVGADVTQAKTNGKLNGNGRKHLEDMAGILEHEMAKEAEGAPEAANQPRPEDMATAEEIEAEDERAPEEAPAEGPSINWEVTGATNANAPTQRQRTSQAGEPAQRKGRMQKLAEAIIDLDERIIEARREPNQPGLSRLMDQRTGMVGQLDGLIAKRLRNAEARRKRAEARQEDMTEAEQATAEERLREAVLFRASRRLIGMRTGQVKEQMSGYGRATTRMEQRTIRMMDRELAKDTLNTIRELLNAAEGAPEYRMQADTALRKLSSVSNAASRIVTDYRERANMAEARRALPKNATPEELANVAAEMAKIDWADSRAMGRMASAIARPTSWRYAHSYRVASMLFNTATLLVNAVGGSMEVGGKPLVRLSAAAVEKPLAALEHRTPAATRQMAAAEGAGIVQAMPLALREFMTTLRTGISSRPVRDFRSYKPGIFGGPLRPLNWGFTLMAAADDFNRVLALHGSQLAYATLESQRSGKPVSYILSNLIEYPWIAKLSSEEMQRTTYMERLTGTLRLVQRARGNPLVQTIIPFFETLANIARMGGERTGWGLVRAGRIVREGREQAQLNEGRIPGGTFEEAARLRGEVAIGVGLCAAAFFATLAGAMVAYGPSDDDERKDWRDQGGQSFSAKIGGKWVSWMQALGAWAPPVAVGSAMAEAYMEAAKKGKQNTRLGKSDVDNAVDMVTVGLSETASRMGRFWLDMTALRGVSDFFLALSSPQRAGTATQFVESLATSYVPFGSMMASIQRATDNTIRDPEGVVEAIMARMPGLSKQVPAARTQLGEERTRGTSGGMAFLPVRASDETTNRIYQEYARLRGQGFDIGIGEVGKTISVQGATVELTPAEQGEYQRRAGETTAQVLQKTMDAAIYQRANDSVKAKILEKVVSQARERAAIDYLRTWNKDEWLRRVKEYRLRREQKGA